MASPRSADEIRTSWMKDARWQGIARPYVVEDVVRLRGTLHVEHTLARQGATALWNALRNRPPVRALGALTGNQAVQQVAAGLPAIYCSGWQVAADANSAGQMYPDQSPYPSDSVPELVRRINQALQRADQIAHLSGDRRIADWFAPIVADAEAGFGGDLNAFEVVKAMIAARAPGGPFLDHVPSGQKCGHIGRQVLVPNRAIV